MKNYHKYECVCMMQRAAEPAGADEGQVPAGERRSGGAATAPAGHPGGVRAHQSRDGRPRLHYDRRLCAPLSLQI